MKSLSPIRTLAVTTPTIFLTFDDGPDPDVTPRVLDSLRKHHARATFFVIGEKVLRHEDLVRRIIAEGHAVGNHTWDHSYRNFFTSGKTLRSWITQADEAIEKVTGKKAVGFRSPAGVLTPPLLKTVAALNHRLLHWNLRFYDTSFPFSKEEAEAAAKKMESGNIILLHDANTRDVSGLLSGLETLLELGKERGFEFREISV